MSDATRLGFAALLALCAAACVAIILWRRPTTTDELHAGASRGREPRSLQADPPRLHGFTDTPFAVVQVHTQGGTVQPIADAGCELRDSTKAVVAAGQTNADGVCLIRSVPLAVDLHLTVRHPTYEPYSQTLRLERSGEIVDVALHGVSTLEGIVRGATGKGLPNVAVTVQVGQALRPVLTDDDGRYLVERLPGSATANVTFVLTGYHQQQRTVELHPHTRLDVTLLSAVRCVVEIDIPSARESDLVVLNALVLIDGVHARAGGLSFRSGRTLVHTTRAHLPVRARVVISDDTAQHEGVGQFVHVSDHQASAGVTLTTLRALKVQLVLEDRPVSSEVVWWDHGHHVALIATDANGFATVIGSWKESLFWNRHGVSEPVSLNADLAHEAIQLSPANASRVLVTTPELDLAKLSVERRHGGDAELARKELTAPEGQRTLELAVPPGDYRVLYGAAPLTDYVVRVGFRGTASYTLPLSDGPGRIHGVTAAGASVELWRMSGHSLMSVDRVSAGGDGTFAFEEVWSGEYVVVAKTAQAQARSNRVRLSAGARVDVGRLSTYEAENITFQFLRHGGAPYAGEMVSLTELPGQLNPRFRLQTDEHGLVQCAIRLDAPVLISTRTGMGFVPKSGAHNRIVWPSASADVRVVFPKGAGVTDQVLWLSGHDGVVFFQQLPILDSDSVGLPPGHERAYLIASTSNGTRFFLARKDSDSTMRVEPGRDVDISQGPPGTVDAVVRCLALGGIDIAPLAFTLATIPLRKDASQQVGLPAGSVFVCEYRNGSGTTIGERRIEVDG